MSILINSTWDDRFNKVTTGKKCVYVFISLVFQHLNPKRSRIWKEEPSFISLVVLATAVNWQLVTEKYS